MREPATDSILLQSAREQKHLFLTQNEIRRRGLTWLWSGVGIGFLVWFVLDWLWPVSPSSGTAQQTVLWGRLLVALFMGVGIGVLRWFQTNDLAVMMTDWGGWLLVSLYLGIAGSWLYGGASTLVLMMLVLLIVARGVLLPGGVRQYWPPVLLLWGMYVLSLFAFANASGGQWLAGPMLYTQVLLGLACVLGGFASWLLAQYHALASQTDRLGRYEIGDRLRTRGMSQLYRGWHRLLQQPCIIKRIPCYANNWDAAVEEFRREAKLVMGIQNPHVVRVFDFGETQVDMYLAMEFLDGINLNTLLRLQGPLKQARAIHLMRQVCAGLTEVHRQGILHQDLKPSNLFLIAEKDEFDYVKIIDFGISRRIDASARQLEARGRGKIPGTPAYMSPERFQGESSIQSDIYAMGAVLYSLLTGRPPFRATTVKEYQQLHEQEPLPLSHLQHNCQHLLPQVQAVLEKAMAKEPTERFPSVEAMKEALVACQQALGPWSQEQAQESWEDLQKRRESLLAGKPLPAPLSDETFLPEEERGTHEPDESDASAPTPKQPQAKPFPSPALVLPEPDAPELEPPNEPTN